MVAGFLFIFLRENGISKLVLVSIFSGEDPLKESTEES